MLPRTTSKNTWACRVFNVAACLVLTLALPPGGPARAQDLDTYRQVQQWTPYMISEPGRFYSVTDYEFSRINQGRRKIEWHTASERLFYRGRTWIPYLQYTRHDRDRRVDHTLDFGAQYLKPNWSLRSEAGFGMDTDFIYRFQTTHEFERKLYGGLYGKWRARYLHYEPADVLIVSPVGATYYFGNHYVTADYNISVTESRRDAHFATFKGNVVLHPRLHLYAGGAAGSRLFDIFEVGAGQQESFIIFAGIHIRIHERLQLTAGYSYSEEKPAFIKRSVNAAFSMKF